MFNQINLSDSNISYTQILESIEELATEIINTDTDEDVWYIENDITLDSLIVGSYWFLADYHGGQDSLEYRVLSALGNIYKPGMSDGPEPDSSEELVYNTLEEKIKND